MDKLRAIETFTAIAKYGSLTEAANRLGKSLPSVVRTLAQLEGEIGFRLFNRSTRNIALTEEGKVYLDHCSEMMRELSNTEDQLSGDSVLPEGRVHITTPVIFGEKFVIPALLDLYEENPKLNISLFSDDQVVDLVSEQIDIAVRIGHLEDSSFIARHVGNVRRLLCASPSFIEKYGDPQKPQELRERPCIQFNGKGSALPWLFDTGNSLVKVPIEGAFVSNMVKSSIQACVGGLGFSLFLEYQVYEEVNDGRLRVVLRDYEPEVMPVHLVYPHAKPLPSRVKAVLDGLSKSIKQKLRVAKIQ